MSGAETRIVRAEAHTADEATVAAAVEALTAGELVVFPTDTVYGIACRADDAGAVERLFAAKRRPLSKPLPLLLAEAEALAEVATDLDEGIWRLARRFWPGPLTMVVRKTASVSDMVTAGQPTVGVRVPDMILTCAILRRCPFPVAATSANLSEGDPACAVDELPRELLTKVALVVDTGRCPGMMPSTVVDVTVRPARVLRRGPVAEDDIAKASAEPSL